MILFDGLMPFHNITKRYYNLFLHENQLNPVYNIHPDEYNLYHV